MKAPYFIFLFSFPLLADANPSLCLIIQNLSTCSAVRPGILPAIRSHLTINMDPPTRMKQICNSKSLCILLAHRFDGTVGSTNRGWTTARWSNDRLWVGVVSWEAHDLDCCNVPFVHPFGAAEAAALKAAAVCSTSKTRETRGNVTDRIPWFGFSCSKQ